MIRLNKTLWFTLILIGFIDCTQYSDSTYFNGDIYSIDKRMKKVKNVVLTPVPLDGTNFGGIAVYDSLMFFWNTKLPDRFFNAFNLDTGKEIGTFLNKGQGPDEIIAISTIYQFFEEENELKTLLFAANEKKIFKWNISQSIEQNTTVIDTIIPYSCSTENNGACYNYIFRKNDNVLFTHVQSMTLNDEEASLPFYQKRTLYSDKLLKEYLVYKKSIKNEEASIIPEAFFGSNDAFKPDGSQIAQAMTRLHQINILNTETGEIIGYRMEGSPDFSIFKKKKKIINFNYVRVQADNDYIYASYWGKETWGQKEIPFINTIHVFDWNGRWIQELITDHPVHEMCLDRVRNRLYTTNADTDEVFYLELDGLIN